MLKITFYTIGAAAVLGCICTSVQAFIINDTSNLDSFGSISSDNLLNKHESVPKCTTLKPDEYVMYPSNDIFVPSLNKTLEESSYKFDGEYLKICVPPKLVYSKEKVSIKFTAWTVLFYFSAAGEILSIIFLSIHLLVFAVVTDLHNLAGCYLASLCFTLLLSYLCTSVGHIDTISKNKNACNVMSVTNQFLCLASFFWMFILALDIFQSIRNATKNLRTCRNAFNLKKYTCSSLICWGTSLLFTVAALIADCVEAAAITAGNVLRRDYYKPLFFKSCWFQSKYFFWLFFAGHVFAIIFFNFILFGITAYILFSNRMKTGEDDYRAQQKKSFLIYLRLAIIMGVAWIARVLAYLLQIPCLWDVFAIFDTFHGFFIFVAFTCRKKTLMKFKSKLLKACENTLWR
ncbi:hypothetical protein AVEN_224882-1 [Araneus ventricosus]|uniref:G-protein coupled receptors family 2 profile 2 domain-containing protein n=1 Tax=Araneus ventricosus TaxID=182803 RepID=A0A4Y2VW73_ARAVE|nr:hypothetical protein AVEN_224882-1 [Araneus ventricosus]